MKISSKKERVMAFFAIALIFVSGCNAATVKTVKTGVKVIEVFAAGMSIFSAMKEVEAANLDIEERKLEIEGLDSNGEEMTIIENLSDAQVQKLLDDGKVSIKLKDGSSVPVALSRADINVDSDFEKIKNYLASNSVDFKNDTVDVSGRIAKAWVQETDVFEDSGAAARIKWDDNIISSILFLKNSRVRVWEKGNEYGGKWSWDSRGELKVKMDKGSQYSFGS